MPQTCILTDITAQFQTPQFDGYEHVYYLPVQIQNNNKIQSLQSINLPVSASIEPKPEPIPPDTNEVLSTLYQLSQKYHEIIAVLPSVHLSPSYEFITQILTVDTNKQTPIRLIDTRTTSIGLGLLVQAAAQAAKAGLSATEIIPHIRNLTKRVYTVFYTRNLKYLYHAGYLDPGQAVVGEMLELIPMYIIDGRRLVCLRKARNHRQMVKNLFEFIQEFEKLAHIGIIRQPQVFESVSKTLLDRLPRDFPATKISFHHFEPSLSAVLGPQSLGLVALEAEV